MEQAQEVVDDVGPEVPGVHVLGPLEKGPGIVQEKRELKNGLRVGDIPVPQGAV